jgi:methylated-DNA-[protein]-cysteine S-methyltransferase
MSTNSNFREKVYNIVRKIGRGKTMTYAQVAKAIGNPGAARAVGNALSQNKNPEVPCHRVIRSDGKTGGYNKGPKIKIAILKKEGAIK